MDTRTGSTLLAANTLATMGIANNGTMIAEMMSNYDKVSDLDTGDSMTGHDGQDGGDSLAVMVWGTIFAVMVWQLSPELVRLSAIAVWFLCFYFLVSLYFTDNEAVQDAVFSLLSFSPIVGALSVFLKTRRMAAGQMQEDARLSIQFLSAFGGVIALSHCSPLATLSHLGMLTALQRVIAVFIAVSVLGFMALLLKNCNFMWYGLRRDCAVHEIDDDVAIEVEEPLDFDLKTRPQAEMDSVSVDSVSEVVMPTVAVAVTGKRTKKRRRRRKKHH